MFIQMSFHEITNTGKIQIMTALWHIDYYGLTFIEKNVANAKKGMQANAQLFLEIKMV